jgi:hypothetical protein
MSSPLLLALLAPVHAAIPVLISPFEAQDREAAALAERMPGILAAELAPDPDLRVLDPALIPDIGDTPAPLYLDICPPGQLEGCSYVVGEAGGAAYAILGSVRTMDPEPAPVRTEAGGPAAGDAKEEPAVERLVSLRILDVKFYNEVLSVELVHTDATEESFADAVLLMMQDAASGWVGGEVDIRSANTPTPKEAVNKDEAASELQDLSQELGEVEGQGRARASTEPRREERPHRSLAELRAQEDPSTWRQLGVSEREYLAWWNSGWDFASWSRRLDGRQGQLLLRAHAGLGLGPTHGLYYGRVSYYGAELLLEEIYVTHELNQGVGSHVGLSAGYGLLPTLELEVGASREGGRYQVDVRMVYQPEGTEALRENTDEPQGMPQLWLGARWVPLPAATLRPVAGLGVAWWFGHTLGEDQLPMDVTPAFTAPVLTSLRGLVGGELRLRPGLDLLLQAPVHLILAGHDPAIYDDLRIDGPDYGMQDKREPGTPLPVAASLQLGVQARLGGRKVRSEGPQVFDDELDELD